MKRLKKLSIFLGVLLMLVFVGVVYAQYKVKTLQHILPGAWRYHADRYYETYVSPSSAMPDSVTVLIPPLQYKSRIHSIVFRKGKYTSECSDSVIVKFYSGRQSDLGGNLLTGDTTVVSDSLFHSLTMSSSVDTIGPGEKIGVISYMGKTDSTAITDSLLNFQVRFELEIIE